MNTKLIRLVALSLAFILPASFVSAACKNGSCRRHKIYRPRVPQIPVQVPGTPEVFPTPVKITPLFEVPVTPPASTSVPTPAHVFPVPAPVFPTKTVMEDVQVEGDFLEDLADLEDEDLSEDPLWKQALKAFTPAGFVLGAFLGYKGFNRFKNYRLAKLTNERVNDNDVADGNRVHDAVQAASQETAAGIGQTPGNAGNPAPAVVNNTQSSATSADIHPSTAAPSSSTTSQS